MAVVGVGILMMVYVVFGGMLATTWVQIVKAFLLLSCTVVVVVLVLAHFGFHILNFFAAASRVPHHQAGQILVTRLHEAGTPLCST